MITPALILLLNNPIFRLKSKSISGQIASPLNSSTWWSSIFDSGISRTRLTSMMEIFDTLKYYNSWIKNNISAVLLWNTTPITHPYCHDGWRVIGKCVLSALQLLLCGKVWPALRHDLMDIVLLRGAALLSLLLCFWDGSYSSWNVICWLIFSTEIQRKIVYLR